MRTVTLEDKLLRVSEDGTIIRLNDDLSVKDKVVIRLLDNKNKKYPTVSVTIKGVQKHFYASRVIAETFIPNPHNHRFCEIIDGDPFNLNVNNLRWMSETKRIDKMLKTAKKNSIECEVCGHLYHQNYSKCTNCTRESKKQKNSEAKFNDKKERLNSELGGIDVSQLTPRNQKIIEMRKQGKALQEIAEHVGVTREGVRKIIINAKAGKCR